MAPLILLFFAFVSFIAVPFETVASSDPAAVPGPCQKASDWRLRKLTLVQGENVVSFPVLPFDHAIESVLPPDVASKVRLIRGYDNGSKRWRQWRPGSGAGNTLQSLEFGCGYWFVMKEGAVLDMSGWEAPASATIHLYRGWNLVGWLGTEGTPVENALKPIEGRWRRVRTWQEGRWLTKSTAPTAGHASLSHAILVFRQGRAYWILADKGGDWTPPPDAGPVGWIVGDATLDGYGIILATMDGGQTWVRQGTPGVIPNANLSDIKAIDARNAWAVGDAADGYGVILRTSDGGKQWVRQGGPGRIPDVALKGIGVVDMLTAWVVGEGGTILLTRDGGLTWIAQESPTKATLYVVAALDSRNAWIIGDQDGGYAVILRTTNGGRTWGRQGTQETVQAPGLIDISAVDRQTAWAVGADHTVLRTDDGGENWVVQMTSHPEPGAHVNGVCAFDSQNAWAAVDFDYFFKTTQAGAPWITVNTSASEVQHGYYLITVTGLHMDMVWSVGTSYSWSVPLGNIIATCDGGQSWVQQVPPVDARFRRISFVGAPK